MTGSAEEKSAGSGEAGHWGKDVRSDLHVAIEPRDSGGLEITMESRVAPYYGESILAQARQVLEVAWASSMPGLRSATKARCPS